MFGLIKRALHPWPSDAVELAAAMDARYVQAIRGIHDAMERNATIGIPAKMTFRSVHEVGIGAESARGLPNMSGEAMQEYCSRVDYLAVSREKSVPFKLVGGNIPHVSGYGLHYLRDGWSRGRGHEAFTNLSDFRLGVRIDACVSRQAPFALTLAAGLLWDHEAQYYGPATDKDGRYITLDEFGRRLPGHKTTREKEGSAAFSYHRAPWEHGKNEEFTRWMRGAPDLSQARAFESEMVISLAHFDVAVGRKASLLTSGAETLEALRAQIEAHNVKFSGAVGTRT